MSLIKKEIKFKYSYLKSLYKKFKKQLPAKNTKNSDVRSAVKKELYIVKIIALGGKKVEKNNIKFELERKNLHNKPQGFIFAEYNKRKLSIRNKALKEISESVREFIKEKLLIQEIEKNAKTNT